MLFGWIIRIVVLLIVLRLLLRFVTGLFQGLRGEGPRRPIATAARGAGTPMALVKDPVCGTYVPNGTALTRVMAGTTYSFCSEACLRAFERRGTASRPA
jgi:uncharacterized protein